MLGNISISQCLWYQGCVMRTDHPGGVTISHGLANFIAVLKEPGCMGRLPIDCGLWYVIVSSLACLLYQLNPTLSS
jgi:hypothetical protein